MTIGNNVLEARTSMSEATARTVKDPNPEHAKAATAAAAGVHVIALSDLEPGRGAPADAPHAPPRAPLLENLAELPGPLRQIKARLTVCVGSAEVTLGELLGARADQVIRLDRTVEQPVDVLLEGQVVARGTLVAAEDHFAVRITELPLADAAASRKP